MRFINKIKQQLKKIHWFLSSQFGVDIFRFIKGFYRFSLFYKDMCTFKRIYHGKIKTVPCLHDRFEESGSVQNEYFWQDLVVAQYIYNKNPIRHIDVGSRVDGFVAHVATFRELVVVDIRPMMIAIPNVLFKQGDVMNPASFSKIIKGVDYDSVSCLHALEHFGLGRYGDPINLDGHKLGLESLSSILKENGILYLSVPIGEELIEFNANRVFSPRTIIELAMQYKLEFNSLTILTGNGIEEEIISLDEINEMNFLDNKLGLFIFSKI